MARILANDGIASIGKSLLEQAGHTVITEKIPQENLIHHLNDYDAIIVRSATQIRKKHIDASPSIKMIVRAGVGMDNIDVEYGISKGINVSNTPEASSRAVAELVLAHMFSLSRHLHKSHYEMRSRGATDFKSLKKSYSKGFELKGKTIGIIGFGRIGQELGKLCLGIGMKVQAADMKKDTRQLKFPDIDTHNLIKDVKISLLENLYAQADIISIHLPDLGKPLIGKNELDQMKPGVLLINTARGGMIHEGDMLDALNHGKVAGVALDVFENEPEPSHAILNHPSISLSPHIGASTVEAQDKIAKLASKKIIDFFK